MSQDASIPNFDEWVEYVFTQATADGRSHPGSSGYEEAVRRSFRFSSDLETGGQLSVADETQYRIRLFNQPVAMLARYDDRQINYGFVWLFGSESNFHWDLADHPKSPTLVNEYLDSIARLFQNYFDLDSPGHPRADRCHAASMMWESGLGVNVLAQESKPKLTDAVLKCLNQFLNTCKSEACLRCALHGLGHLAAMRPQECAEIIDCYLERSSVPEALREYALQAKAGDLI